MKPQTKLNLIMASRYFIAFDASVAAIAGVNSKTVRHITPTIAQYCAIKASKNETNPNEKASSKRPKRGKEILLATNKSNKKK